MMASRHIESPPEPCHVSLERFRTLLRTRSSRESRKQRGSILKIFDVPGSNSGVLYLYPHVGYCSFAVRGAFILLEMELMARKIDREL